jgi:hypothetical protein
MSIGPAQPISAAVRWAQEWQRLNLTATNEAIGHYLRSCANLAMARTPQQALAALHKAQTDMLGHSVDTIAEATRLWRKQNTELLVMRTAHARAPKQPAAKLAAGVRSSLP